MHIEHKSLYVEVSDGTKIAVSYWLPAANYSKDPLPFVFSATRYWREYQLHEDRQADFKSHESADYFLKRGYGFAVMDVRGTGASFGSRNCELGLVEANDIGDVISWLSQQSWCNGKIGALGNSYLANTAFLAAASAGAGLKAIAPSCGDYRIFEQNYFPGGIPNKWMKEKWGKMIWALDSNQFHEHRQYLGTLLDENNTKNIIGVRPVDEDVNGELLLEAVAQHLLNLKVFELAETTYKDDWLAGSEEMARANKGVPGFQTLIETNDVPTLYQVGWYDVGSAAGAVAYFQDFSGRKSVIIGPWDHGASTFVDPYKAGEQQIIKHKNYLLKNALIFFDVFVRNNDHLYEPNLGKLHYFTYGKNKWCSTELWPPENVAPRRYYFHQFQLLSPEKPIEQAGQDCKPMDLDATTGTNNRWHTQLAHKMLLEDRREQDKNLLYYQTKPLSKKIVITGSPVFCGYLCANAENIDLFVYLELVHPDESVTIITEGCLRVIHRKEVDLGLQTDEQCPVHSFMKADSAPLRDGEITKTRVALNPTSIEIKTKYAIRVAIAGADRETFSSLDFDDAKSVEVTIFRSNEHSSYIDLPIAEAVPTTG